MSDFIKQLPALLGVMIGAFGSYVVVMRGDRARFRREHAARWQERQLAAYTDYALTLKKTVTLHRRVAAHLGHDSHPHPLPQADASPLLVDAADARSAAGEGLLMLGSPEVAREAAHGSGEVLHGDPSRHGTAARPLGPLAAPAHSTFLSPADMTPA